MHACETGGDLPRATLDKAREMYRETFRCGATQKFEALMERLQLTYSDQQLFRRAMHCTVMTAHELGKDVDEVDEVTLEGFARFVSETSKVPGLLNEKELESVFSRYSFSRDGFLRKEQFTLRRYSHNIDVQESHQKAAQLKRMVSLLVSEGNAIMRNTERRRLADPLLRRHGGGGEDGEGNARRAGRRGVDRVIRLVSEDASSSSDTAASDLNANQTPP